MVEVIVLTVGRLLERESESGAAAGVCGRSPVSVERYTNPSARQQC